MLRGASAEELKERGVYGRTISSLSEDALGSYT